MKQLVWIFLFPIAAYLLLCLGLFLTQRSMLYYPAPATLTADATPLLLNNGSHTLKIWFVDRNADKALIYFGGNAENVAGAIPYLSDIFSDYDLYLPNYRGYGGSSGSPAEEALISDALLLYDHIEDKYNEISVKGRSLGSGVAVQLAAQRDVTGLILVTPYDSMVNTAKHHYPYMPVSLLLKDRYDSAARAKEITGPALLLVAEYDEVIPRKSSDNLARALSEKTTTTAIIKSTGHNDIEQSPAYNLAIDRFLSR